MKNGWMSCLGLMAFTGCGLAAVDDYRNAVPKAESIQIKVPGTNGQALESQQQGLEGETAVFYQMTRAVSFFVNGAGYVTLNLVKTITQYPPTSFDDVKGVAVWGPHTEALSPNTWRLTVTRKAPKEYSYSLDAKAKNDPDTAFLAILTGTHTSTGKVTGHGNFVLDFDSAQKLPEHDKNAVGKAAYTYAHDSLDSDLKVDAQFTQVKDKDTGRLIDATYKYVSNETTGGSLEFLFQGDVDKKPASQLENLALNSRWARSGAGRSDVRASGGDLGTQEATANECWDSNFASRYFKTSFNAALNYGQESACGDLSTAQYSSLRL